MAALSENPSKWRRLSQAKLPGCGPAVLDKVSEARLTMLVEKTPQNLASNLGIAVRKRASETTERDLNNPVRGYRTFQNVEKRGSTSGRDPVTD